MRDNRQTVNGAARPGRAVVLIPRFSILFLLIAVAGLSTLAKNSLYYPQSSSVRYVSIASKMNVVHAPTTIDQTPLESAVRVAAPRPVIPAVHRDQPEVPSVPRIALAVCLQHRSPPACIA